MPAEANKPMVWPELSGKAVFSPQLMPLQRLAGVLAPAAAALVTVSAVQLVELGRFLPQWVSFAVAGALLIAAGARWEWVRDAGHRGGTWVRSLR